LLSSLTESHPLHARGSAAFTIEGLGGVLRDGVEVFGSDGLSADGVGED